MRTVLGVGVMMSWLAACSTAPATVQLEARDADAYANAMKALLQTPAFAENPQAAPGFCVGVTPTGERSPRDPGTDFLSRIDSHAVPLFAYSECEPRPSPGWGSVRHAASGKRVGLIVLTSLETSADGSTQVTLTVDGGAFASAGFACRSTPSTPTECRMTWIS